MKRICVMRHGKSSWEDPALPDEERPVLPKGIIRTERIASFLTEKIPGGFDLLISSNAKRAFQTAGVIARAYAYPERNIRTDKRIYFNGYQRIMDVLIELDDQIGTVALFGHNPDMTYFVNDYLGIRTDNFPTSAVACFTAGTDHWYDLPTVPLNTEFYVTPKDLES